MVDAKKISALTPYVNPIGADLIPIVDTVGNETKSITLTDLGLAPGGGCGINCASVSLTSADILALDVTPIQLVAAPGPGKYIEVLSVDLFLTFITTVYTWAAGKLQIITDTAGTSQMEDPNANGILKATANANRRLLSLVSVALTGGQFVLNKALQIKLTGAATVGDGTLKVKVLYRIITL